MGLERNSLKNSRSLQVIVWSLDTSSKKHFIGGIRLNNGDRKNLWMDSNPKESSIWMQLFDGKNLSLNKKSIHLELRKEMNLA
jgi:hypothetical protein